MASPARRRICLTAVFVLVLGIIALWMPLDIRRWREESGMCVRQISVGIFRPLEFTLAIAAEGFRFSVTAVRPIWLVLTAALTMAGQYLALRAYRAARRG